MSNIFDIFGYGAYNNGRGKTILPVPPAYITPVARQDYINKIKEGSIMELKEFLDGEKAKLDVQFQNAVNVAVSEKQEEIAHFAEEAKQNAIDTAVAEIKHGIGTQFALAYGIIENGYATLPVVEPVVEQVQ